MTASDPATDAEVLARGWHALKQLARHADDPSGLFDHEPHDIYCGPCSKFTRAVLADAPAATVRHLRCDDAQQWQRDVDAADLIAQQYTTEPEGPRP
ncbi:MAG TPA: hypothetical protein VI172_08265 [Candidatus Dormibacteraeota bacterium]